MRYVAIAAALCLALPFMAIAMERKVLIVGIDGVRADCLQAANTPNIYALIAGGAVSWTCQSEDITISGPCWSTILTGVHRTKHGVVDNTFSGSNFGRYPHFFSRLRSLCNVRTASIVHWAPVDTNCERHAAGNLVIDNQYYYQYDSFNRLIQVSARGGVTRDAHGDFTGTPGVWLKHFTYDGLGRLIRVQVPWPSDQDAFASVSRRFFYDGGRRISEFTSEPIFLDGDGTPVKIDKETELTELEMSVETACSREYVWDPVETDRLLDDRQEPVVRRGKRTTGSESGPGRSAAGLEVLEEEDQVVDCHAAIGQLRIEAVVVEIGAG